MERLLFCLLFIAPAVFAQNTITFTAETTTGIGIVTPVLTWSTAPVADDCTASGDWSGAKGASGSETLAPITQSATFSITCFWANSETTLRWTPPTRNTDGSVITDLAGYNAYFGQASGDYPLSRQLADPGANSWVIDRLAAGTWYFVLTSYSSIGTESEYSNEAVKVIGDDTVQDSISITVNAQHEAVQDLTAQ